jgi:biopolymer transport protein ExbD
MMILRLLVCACVAACMSPVVKFGEGKTAKQAQRDTMNEFGPARLATDQKWSGEVTTKKIRVWADNEFRAQNVRWQQSFEEPLALANLVITPNFGLKLVAEYVAWDRHVPGARLEDHLTALIQHDAGNDVFAVVGLTSSLPLVSSTYEQLGMASIGGRHMVLRGYADLEERKLYANAFPDLRAEERELALVHLRHHKTAVVLLHELGHNLGVQHEDDSTTIMHATYSSHATAFSTPAREQMLRTLDHRLARTPSMPSATLASTPEPAKPAVAAAAPREPAVRLPPVVIRVTKKGHTLVDGKQLGDAALDSLLKETFAKDPTAKIVVKEDRNVPAGVVGALLDRAKAIGLTKFEFGWTGK